VPIAEVRTSHVEVDEILKIIDAESRIDKPADPKVVLLLMANLQGRGTLIEK
jgi:hypothetical protein